MIDGWFLSIDYAPTCRSKVGDLVHKGDGSLWRVTFIEFKEASLLSGPAHWVLYGVPA